MLKSILPYSFTFALGTLFCAEMNAMIEAAPVQQNADQPQSTRQGEDSVLKRRIRSELGSADCRRIAQYCRALVCDRLERGKLSDEAISRTLKDKDLLFALHLDSYLPDGDLGKFVAHGRDNISNILILCILR